MTNFNALIRRLRTVSKAQARSAALGFAVVAVGAQLALVGTPRNPPDVLWALGNKSSQTMLLSDRIIEDGFVSYAGDATTAINAKNKSNVAILLQSTFGTTSAPAIEVIRSVPVSFIQNGLTVAAPPRKKYPITNDHGFTDPAFLASGSLDEVFLPNGGTGNINSSDELIIGANNNRSLIGIVANFDKGIRNPAVSTLAITKTIRVGCSSNEPIPDASGLLVYNACNTDAETDPYANIGSIALADVNCDGKLDMGVILNDTVNINDPNDGNSIGQRLFLCLNAGNLNFNCRGQALQVTNSTGRGFDNTVPEPSASGYGLTAFQKYPQRLPGNITRGSLRLMTAPPGSNGCTGGYTAVAYSDNVLYEFNGSIAQSSVSFQIEGTQMTGEIVGVALGSSNTDAIPDPVAVIKPDTEPDSLVDPTSHNALDLISRAELCTGTSAGRCTVAARLPIANGSMTVATPGGQLVPAFEYTKPKLLGTVDTAGKVGSSECTSDGISEIIVAAAARGTDGNTDTISLMAVGSNVINLNLPRSSLTVWAAPLTATLASNNIYVRGGAMGNFSSPSPTSRQDGWALLLSDGTVQFVNRQCPRTGSGP